MPNVTLIKDVGRLKTGSIISVTDRYIKYLFDNKLAVQAKAIESPNKDKMIHKSKTKSRTPAIK